MTEPSTTDSLLIQIAKFVNIQLPYYLFEGWPLVWMFGLLALAIFWMYHRHCSSRSRG
jgi:hypothetical protein